MEHSPRILVLTERVATNCRLTPADRDFFLTSHRAHLRLIPTGRRGCYSLTPTGYVGTIVTPSCRLVIRPKIPLVNLFYLLDPTRPLATVKDLVAPNSDEMILDFLAGRLARLLQERSAAGLHRDYAERTESGPILQGRLDLPAQLREASPRKDRLHSVCDDLTVDVPCNQVARATAELALRSPLLGDRVRFVLRQALAAFADVRSVPLGLELWRRAMPDRRTEAYRPLLDMCRLIADSLALSESAGTTPAPAFLVNMERVFEDHVTRGICSAFANHSGLAVAVQQMLVANAPVTGQTDLTMRPDAVIQANSAVVLVIDAKWKRAAGCPLLPADLYQVLAYCAALGTRRATLIYPGQRNRVWHYQLARTELRVDVRTVRVIGPQKSCADALERLGAVLRRAARNEFRSGRGGAW